VIFPIYQVYINKEGALWQLEDWDGKNENYLAERDMGGQGCRHLRGYIGDNEAIRRRPELAEILKR